MKKNRIYSAFTLAEMMVVMLILSVVMAAFAPVVTTRSKADRNSPWRYSADNSNIYYGLGENQTAMIGQPNKKLDIDPSVRLIINTSDDNQKHIVFKRGEDNILGSLFMDRYNVILGTGSKNGQGLTALGIEALDNNNRGESVTAVGYQALKNNSTGSNNTAFGAGALALNSGGDENTAIGVAALGQNTNAANNVAVGYKALGSNTMGYLNTALGNYAMQNGTETKENVAVGYDALKNNNSGDYTVAVGKAALYTNISGDNNTAVGYDALYFNKTGNQNAALGFDASKSNTSGGGNVAIGYQSLSKNTEGSMNIGIGYQANSYNLSADSTVGMYNTAIGYRSRAINGESIAIGSSSYALDGSIAIGKGSEARTLKSVIGTTVVAENTGIAIGKDARATNGGIAIGSTGNLLGISFNAPTTSVSGVSIGDGSNAGQYSVAIGLRAKAYGTTSGSGYSNVAVGSYAGNTNGHNNTAIGAGACQYVTGSNKTCLGSSSGPRDVAGGTNEPERSWKSDDVERIFIGGPSAQNGGAAVLEVHNGEGTSSFDNGMRRSQSNVVINGNLLIKGSLYLPHRPFGWNGTDDATLTAYYGWDPDCDGGECEFTKIGDGPSNTVRSMYGNNFGGGQKSDRRLKYVGKEITSGLDKIKKLKVFNYTFKKDEKKTPHVGVIAQDLQKVFPDAVKKGDDGYLTIRWEDMFYALINAVKELDAKVTFLIKQENAKDKKIKELEARLDKLEKQFK